MQLNGNFDEDLDMLTPIEELRNPERLDIDEYAKKCRIIGFLIVSNTLKLGPKIIYYYYNNESYLAKKLSFDPAALTEVLILAKHTKFIKGIYKNKALVQKVDMVDEMNRSTFGFILIELSGRGSVRKAQLLAERLEEFLGKNMNDKNLKKKIERTFSEICKEEHK